MYKNIGKKIKNLAKISFLVEAISAVISGIILCVNNTDEIWIGLLVLFVGPIVAWVSSWLLYGYGELIDKTCDIEFNTRNDKRKTATQQIEEMERISKIESLYKRKLITEEEYQKAMHNK